MPKREIEAFFFLFFLRGDGGSWRGVEDIQPLELLLVALDKLSNVLFGDEQAVLEKTKEGSLHGVDVLEGI